MARAIIKHRPIGLDSIGGNDSLTVGGTRNATIGNNDNLSVGVGRNVSVGANDTLSVGSGRNVNVGNTDTLTCGWRVECQCWQQCQFDG
jgi:hypothetical protein